MRRKHYKRYFKSHWWTHSFIRHQTHTLFLPTITRLTHLLSAGDIQVNQPPPEPILPSAPSSRRLGLTVNIDLCVDPSHCVCSAGGQKQLALTSDGVWRQMSLNMQSGSTTRGGTRRCLHGGQRSLKWLLLIQQLPYVSATRYKLLSLTHIQTGV